MNHRLLLAGPAVLAFAAAAAVFVEAQQSPPRAEPNRAAAPRDGAPTARDFAPPGNAPFDGGGPPGFGPGGPPPFGPGGPGRPGGPGGPMGQKRELVKQFDKDGDGRLNKEERQAAREFLKKEQASGQGRRGFGFRGGPGGPGGFGGPGGPGATTRPAGRGMFGPPGGPFGRESRDPAKPGPRISPADVQSYPNAAFYEPTVLRTIFLEFEDADWETEIAEFYHTDVAVPATLTVDGKKYPNVGVQFRGNTSFMMAGAGYKRSLKISLDYADSNQRLYGYKTLDLLNSAEDPTFLHTVLYYDIARRHIPAPKANLIKVAINGESWGVYVNTQPFDKQFVKEWFSEAKGARWKVPVNFRGDSGLAYVGEKIEDYKGRYQAKNEVSEKDWKALIALCRTLKETPSEQLEAALKPMLDVESALWYLAIDNVLINNDGMWTRASDYGLYRDAKGQFHLIPHDVNETFKPMGGPGGPGGPGGFRGPGGPGGPGGFGFAGGNRPSGVALDPLAGVNDANKAILNRLLAVPSFKARYLQHVRTVAQEYLDWNKLQPLVSQYRSLIEKEVEADTRKLYTLAAFKSGVGQESSEAAAGNRPSELGLKAFAEQRRNYLLNHEEIKKLTP